LQTPLRRLEGITYWVIEDPEAIHDFINKEIRKEWMADAESEGRNPAHDAWLQALPKRKWRLEILEVEKIELNPRIMNYVDAQRCYSFAVELEKRGRELRQAIETYSAAIWPLIVGTEDMQLVDGYCRYIALNAIGVTKCYSYIGSQ